MFKDKQKNHLYISNLKSALRIVGGANLIGGNFVLAGWLFIIAEVFGVIEEIVVQ